MGILSAGGAQLREQKNLVDKLKRKLKEKSKLSTKLGVEIKTKEKKLKSHHSKFENFEKNLDSFKKEYDGIKIKKKELEEQAVELMGILDEKKEELQEKDIEFKKLSKIVEKSKSELTKLTKELFEENEKRKQSKEELKQILHRIKKTKSEWTALQKKYKKHKHDFLEDEEEEIVQQTTNKMDVDQDEEEENEQNEKEQNNEEQNIEEKEDEKAMELDHDEDDVSESKENKNKNKNKNNDEMAANVYISENTLSFLMLSEEQLFDINLSRIDSEIESISNSLKASAVNMGAIAAYIEKDNEYVVRLQDLQNVKKKRDDIRQEYENCKTARFDSFMSGFSQITKKLKEMYRMLTCGGDAELELVDSIDPFSEGVQFSVRPPKKSWKNISNLSGGEKTLSSMALVFALHHYKPTPLYVMDEIDAALDFKNVSIVANYIHQRTKNAQFIIISLRNNMFELANRLVGIYKTNNASKSITIDPKLFKLPTSSSSKDPINNNNIINKDIALQRNDNDDMI